MPNARVCIGILKLPHRDAIGKRCSKLQRSVISRTDKIVVRIQRVGYQSRRRGRTGDSPTYRLSVHCNALLNGHRRTSSVTYGSLKTNIRWLKWPRRSIRDGGVVK